MDVKEALSEFNPVLLTRAEGRVALTKHDPLLFAFLYLPHHLKAEDGSMTLSEFHTDLIKYAKTWELPLGKMKEHRDAFIAPRNSGKTTWLFLILPLWAAAHGHKRFIAAFSDSASQAELHLNTFKGELESNERLRADFPDLCEPAKGTTVGRYLMHNRSQIKQSNGFTFMARGADTSSHGMKSGSDRPDVILFDDIEGGESNYGPTEAKKRLETLISDLFPINLWARVCIIGTTTMPNSIIDQIRKVGELEDHTRDEIDPEYRWVLDQNINIHYYPAIFERDGIEQSFWPERFIFNDMQKDRHTRDFAKNMMNRPVSAEAGYWTEDDVQVAELPEDRDSLKTILAVDPAVTTKKASDYTGLAVLSKAPDGKVYVRHATQVKLSSDALREAVTDLCNQFDCRVVLVESNQGGDLWRQVFTGIPAKLRLRRAGTDSKEIRAGRAFDFYKKNRVFHTAHMPMLEEQMYNFPKVKNDDLVDAVSAGVLYFCGSNKAGPITATQYNYIGDN